jgi:rare lipoprotein A
LNSATTERARSIAERTLARSVKALDTRYIRAQKVLLTALGTSTATTNTNTPAAAPAIAIPSETAKWVESTDANFLYYADQFEDGRTANGDTFKHAGFSGARCNIPLGTLAQIRVGEISTTVKINDRPNCAKHADIIDLTRTAFTTLAPLSKGRLAGSFTTL